MMEYLESKRVLSEKELEELSKWIEDLTIDQMQFLKDSYVALLEAQAHEAGHYYVH